MTTEQFRNIRKRLQISQVEMAKVMGISKATISRWERGIFNPSILSWQKLREFCESKGVRLEEVASSPTPVVEKERADHITVTTKIEFDSKQFSEIMDLLREIKKRLSYHNVREELKRFSEDSQEEKF